MEKMKELFIKLKNKFIKFCKWVWQECKDWHTVVIFAVVVVVMYSPVWGGYLCHAIFGWKWCSVMATAYLAFWAGPFTPFFPLCIAITLGIRRIIDKIKGKKKAEKEFAGMETDRLILRQFEENDIDAIYLLLSDEEVNTFLPWFPVKDRDEAKMFFEKRFKDRPYCFAVCLKEDNAPIGCINAEEDDSHDFGYLLRKEYWHQGIVSEASEAVIELLKKDKFPYITATHDRNNPRSGAVMKRMGMHYCYSYKEQWQPKDFPVIFRMYQLNFDGQDERVYKKYWNLCDEHFIEKDI